MKQLSMKVVLGYKWFFFSPAIAMSEIKVGKGAIYVCSNYFYQKQSTNHYSFCICLLLHNISEIYYGPDIIIFGGLFFISDAFSNLENSVWKDSSD